MILEGFKLMVLGMVIVYIFLIVLMIFVVLSSKLFKGRAMAATSSGMSPSSKSADELIAVLSAAVSSYRNRKKGSK